MRTAEDGKTQIYTPFPDLTGWRSSAVERGSSSSLVEVSYEDDNLSNDMLMEACRRVGAAEEADLIVAAWVIVLIHLLSQEDDIEVDVDLPNLAHLQIYVRGDERKEYRISSLLQHIQDAKGSSPGADSRKGNLADNVVCINLPNDAKAEKQRGSALVFSTSVYEGRIQLHLQASPLVHNFISARLHLDQVAACLKHICSKATPNSPALSLNYFPNELLAGDNPLPDPLLDDIESLDAERLEHQMERVVARSPSKIALDFRESLEAAPGDENADNYQWSYEELDRRANVISNSINAYLDKHGDQDDEATPIVALCLEKSPFTYLAILAVLRAGAAWCPIDTDWPEPRRKALLAKSGAKVVLTAGDKVSSEIPVGESMVIKLDTLDYSQESTSTQARRRGSSKKLAYLIWTSGTTGLPKAVGVQHEAAVQALRSLQRVIPHSGSDFRYLQFSAYNFDLMILDVFYTWGLGGTICSSSRSLLLTKLVDLSNAFEVTHTLLTPAVLAMTPRQSIPSLQVVINGGEKLSQTVADIWSVDCCLLNLYGPAEATLIAMSRRVPQRDSVKAPNIGRALPTVSCHAINDDYEVVLKGAIGQLVLGGHQCAVGYLGDEEKTRMQFIEHPQLGRVYKTGDLVRQLWNGEFEYLGRSDDQIKVNGIRIELLEINNVMRGATEQVKDSETLLIKTNKDDDIQLVNFSVVPGSDTGSLIRTDVEAIRMARRLINFAASNMPSYMIPSLFIIVSYFPRTSSAKIDRQALHKELKRFDRLDWLNRISAAGNDRSSEQNVTPREALIRSIVADLCGIEDDAFGRHTTFPSLGLNSIKAISLSHRLMQAGMNATVVDIVQCQTLASLAERLNNVDTSPDDRESKATAFLDSFDQQHRAAVSSLFHYKDLSSSFIKTVSPVTPLQEALLSETIRNKSRYWLHRAYTLPPSIDIDRLQHAIRTVIQRMEILRTCFVNTAQLSSNSAIPSTFVQVVLSCTSSKIVNIEEDIEADKWDRTILDLVDRKLNLQATGTEPPLGFLIVKGAEVQLIAVLHHALYDQITLGLMEDAIAVCYESSLKSLELKPFSSALPLLIAWDDHERQSRKEAWNSLLSRYPKGHAVTLPNMSGQDAVSSESSTLRYHLPTSISLNEISAVATELQTSVRPILQAAWAAVLCAHCDTSSLLLGDSISARITTMRFDNIAGPLLDTLPVPICVDSTYRQMIKEIDDYHKQAIASLPVPLRHIRAMVEVPNDFPLYAAVFVFEPPGDNAEQTGKSKLLHDYRDFGISVEHDIAVEVTITADGHISLGLVVKDCIVSSDYAKIILSQWKSAIRQAMTQPDSLASDFSPEIFSEDLLSVSRVSMPGSLDSASKVPVFAVLSKWVIKTPDSIAVEFHASLEQRASKIVTKTYKELDQESTRVSLILRRTMTAKSVVAVCLHRCVETYVTLLAVFKAGLTYLPVDTSLPMQRKNDLMKLSGAACLVWSDSTQWSLEQTDSINTISIDSPAFLQTTDCLTRKDNAFDMDSAAYIIFTSGSTGMPKGCVLTYKNLSSAIEAFRLTYKDKAPGTLNQSTRFLARSVEAFDVALLEALLPLQVGGTIVTAPRNVILQDMATAMQVMQVTHAAVVPSLFYANGRRIVPSDLPCLKALIVGGERITQDVITAWADSRVPLFNAYGPSEACIGTSIARMSLQDSTNNIGAPFPGTQYLVLKDTDKGDRLALRGEAGELCIGGLQVGSYLGQSSSSAFIKWRGQRIYRTGDKVRLRKDDVTEYMGRISNGQGSTQVKIRGVRIEVSEIDSVLGKASEVVRFCHTRVYGEPSYLVTFIAQQIASQMEEQELQFLDQGPLAEEANRLLHLAKERLPSYMNPRIIVPIEHIPLSSISGKIDGKRLDDWYQKHESDVLQLNLKPLDDDQRDLSKGEVIVKEEVQKLLASDTHLGPSTNIFSLGLDSLNVIQLSGALVKRGIQVDVSHIMANPTIEAIAKMNREQPQVLSNEQFDFTEEARQKCKLDITTAFPLLPLQESMITQTLSAQAEDRSHYINLIRLSCKRDDIDRKKLECSIEATLSSHQIYKTVFIEVEGRIVQAVLKEKPSWQLEEPNFEEVATQEIKMTLNSVPPLRYCVTRSNDVLFAIHHALYDGESLSALLEEIERRYDGNGGESADRFDRYVKEVHRHDMDFKQQAWKQMLCDYAVTPFPCLTGEKMPLKDSMKRLSVEYKLRTSLALLKQRARHEKMTLQLLFIKAFAELYARYTGQEEVVFGLVLGGRSNSNATIHGPCINTVPFCFDVNTKDWKKQIQSTYSIALANQHISLPGLARILQVSGALFNTLFSYLGPIKSSEFFQKTSSDLMTEYPFAVEVQELPQEDRIVIRAVFNPEYVPEKQAQLFLRQLDSSLSEDPTSKADTDILAIENEHPVIPEPSDHFLAKFRHQVDKQPDAVAFAFSRDFSLANEETTYQQLDQTSTAIASELVKTQGSVIGVLLKQCSSLYPLLLGIWKAGKVYLPLDPSLPYERLAYMTSVAEPACIVSARSDVDLAARLGSSICIDDLLRCPIASVKGETEPDLMKPAYIMFTSGSSGTPKGVQISHLALAAAIYSWSQILPYTSDSRILQLASPGFDVFMIEVCMPLALGFSFASAAKEDLLDDLEVTFSNLQLTMADLPAVLAATVRPDKIKGGRPLQWLMSGGDVIEDRVIEKWSKYGLINAWGPTETTIGNTLGFVSNKSSRSRVGRAYPTSSIYILVADASAITYRGCIGEIAVGGPQLADKYIGNAELTREKFTVLSNGVRVYRTGDRGRLLHDGSLECLGRIDSGQVKINSQRVELKEIELQLKRHSGILDALVLYLEYREMQSKQLIAFIVVEGVNQRSSDEVEFRQDEQAGRVVGSALDKAKERLASYMIPSLCLIVAGSGLPLTPNNKIDAKRLQTAYSRMSANEIRQLDASSDVKQTTRKWTNTEVKLRLIIADFCKVDEEEVERDISFYRLGIDSISGFRLLKRLREKGFERLSLRDILQSSTIVSLATLIDGQQQNGKQHNIFTTTHQMDAKLRMRCDVSTFTLDKTDKIKRLLPCTPLQEGLLLESLSSGLYVHHHMFKVRKESLSVIIAAIHAAVKAHDILRTTFHLIDGQFVQAVHTNAQLETPTITETNDLELTALQLISTESLIDETDLGKPLFSIKCLQSTKVGIALIDLCLHHALYDGETLKMLFDEIDARASGQSVQQRLPFEHLLPHLLSREEDERFIVDQFDKCQGTLVDQSGSRSSQLARKCHYSERHLHIKIEALSSFASQAGVSVHIVALYAFVKLLCRLTRQRDVVFAQLFSLRDASAGAENVMGPALNSVLTRCTLPDAETTLESLVRMQKDNDATRDHRRASMAKVLNHTRKLKKGKAIEFDTLFDFQQGKQDAAESDSRIMTPWETKTDESSQYTLNVQFRQRDDSISIIAVGDSKVFSQEELNGHLETLEQILESTMANCDQASTSMPSKLDDLSSLPFAAAKVIGKANGVKASATKTNPRELSKEEKMVLSIVFESSQLAKDEVDVTTPINQLGLDSIMAIKLASRLRAAGLVVGVADVLQGKTVEGICRRIAEKNNGIRSRSQVNGYKSSSAEQEKREVTSKLNISADKIEAVLPLLPGQDFEMAEYIKSKGRSGIFTFLYRLKSDYIDADRMEKSWHRLCATHAILRTFFVLYEGNARQVIQAEVDAKSWQSRQLDGSMSDLLKDESKWTEWVQDACKIDAELRYPPNAACIVSASDGVFFALRFNHALYDAWTVNYLARELWRLYEGENSVLVVRQGSDHIDLVKFLTAERHSLSGEAEAYWKGILKGVDPCLIGDSPPVRDHKTATLLCPSMLKSASSVEKQLRRQGISLGTAFVSAWSKCLLNQLPSHEKVAFGLYRRGRSSEFEGTDTVASNCMNVLPLVIDRKQSSTLADLCHFIKDQMDEQSRFESTTSIGDILSWTDCDTAPWNTYLNLVWDDEEQQDDSSHSLEQIEIPEYELEAALDNNSKWRKARLGDMQSDVSINLHWDRKNDCINAAVRYRCNVISNQQVKAIVEDIASNFEDLHVI